MSASAASSINKKDYQCIYPQYIDSNLAPSEGRRISKTQGVPSPSLQEVHDALRLLGYAPIFDATKSLPCSQAQGRQNPAPKGVLRVQIKTPQGQHYIKKSEFDNGGDRAPTIGSYPNKNQLLIRVASLIRAKGANRKITVIPTADELAKQVMDAWQKEPEEKEKPAGKAVTGKKK